MFASPGPIYEPQLAGSDPWRWAPALTALGIGPDDLVLNCFNYHLSPAGMMFDEACRAVGARVVPAGVGMTEVQARVVGDLGVTAYIGLPSYLSALSEAYRSTGQAAERWRVRKALVTAEPMPPPLRRVPVRHRGPGADGLWHGGARADRFRDRTGPGPAPRAGRPHRALRPGDGSARTGRGAWGGRGVGACSESYPLLRFGTGDVSRWELVDGELRLAGVLGRVGAAVKVRGMFIHPHQAAEVLAELRSAGLVEGAFVIDQVGGVDVLGLEVTADEGADPQSTGGSSRAALPRRPPGSA